MEDKSVMEIIREIHDKSKYPIYEIVMLSMEQIKAIWESL
jgi:hypothetical protein